MVDVTFSTLKACGELRVHGTPCPVMNITQNIGPIHLPRSYETLKPNTKRPGHSMHTDITSQTRPWPRRPPGRGRTRHRGAPDSKSEGRAARSLEMTRTSAAPREAPQRTPAAPGEAAQALRDRRVAAPPGARPRPARDSRVKEWPALAQGPAAWGRAAWLAREGSESAKARTPSHLRGQRSANGDGSDELLRLHHPDLSGDEAICGVGACVRGCVSAGR
jgi:hypothetical protein